MEEMPSGEEKSTEKTTESIELHDAVCIVNAAIADEEKRLKRIAEDESHAPVTIEGETTTGYDAQVRVNPAKAAKIMLNHWYPTFAVLEEDAPDEMWDELAGLAGLAEVGTIDI